MTQAQPPADRRAAITAIVREVLARWLVPGYHPHVSTPWCITQGPCAEFAEEVVDLVHERLPGVEAAVEDIDGAGKAIGREFNGFHAFVKADGLYYDSQETEGVRNAFHLPFMARELRTQILFEELEADGHDGDDPDDEADAGPSPMV